MTSQEIIKLLRAKHSEDIFVAECKDGPSGGSFARMDAWSMPRSWAHPAITAYEIKVSRSDFVRDNKWQKYLGCCNLFYFVAAAGIIDASELPPEAGLLEASKSGGRLFLRKKATLRQVTIPESVFRYVLMNRCIITADDNSSYKPRSLEEQMTKNVEDRRYGHMLGKRIGAMYKKDVLEIETRNVDLEEKMKRYDKHIEFLKKIGFDPNNSWIGEHTLGEKVREIRSGFSDRLIPDITRMIVQLEHFKGSLDELVSQPVVSAKSNPPGE